MKPENGRWKIYSNMFSQRYKKKKTRLKTKTSSNIFIPSSVFIWNHRNELEATIVGPVVWSVSSNYSKVFWLFYEWYIHILNMSCSFLKASCPIADKLTRKLEETVYPHFLERHFQMCTWGCVGTCLIYSQNVHFFCIYINKTFPIFWFEKRALFGSLQEAEYQR